MISYADNANKVFIKNILGSEDVCTWQLSLNSNLTDVAFHDNQAYVLDDNNKRIYKFGLSGGSRESTPMVLVHTLRTMDYQI